MVMPLPGSPSNPATVRLRHELVQNALEQNLCAVVLLLWQGGAAIMFAIGYSCRFNRPTLFQQ